MTLRGATEGSRPPISTTRLGQRRNLIMIISRAPLTAAFLSTYFIFNLLTVTPALSWFDKGHRITGLIAEANLTAGRAKDSGGIAIRVSYKGATTNLPLLLGHKPGGNGNRHRRGNSQAAYSQSPG